MNTQYFLQDGQILKYNQKANPSGLFSLNKFIKKMLTLFHVSFVDDCCESSPTSAPMRYNITAGNMQYYNADTQAWVDISAF